MRKLLPIAAILAALALSFSTAALAAPSPAVSAPVPPTYKLTVSPTLVWVKRGSVVPIQASASQLNGPNGAFCTMSVTGEGLKNFVVNTAFVAPGLPPFKGSISTPALYSGVLQFNLNCGGSTVAKATVIILVHN